MRARIRLLAAMVLGTLGVWSGALAADMPGVTATEIKIGGVFPFSGPASSIGLVGRGVLAYVNSINDRGGINGRKINYIALDDAYSPPKAVEHVRKLVESDEVAFMFSQLGTPGNSATAKYLTGKKVPTIAITVRRFHRPCLATACRASRPPESRNGLCGAGQVSRIINT